MHRVSFAERMWGFLARYTVLIVLTGLVILFSILSPRFLTVANTQNVAGQLAFNAIAAFGEVVVLAAGGIDLSIGSVLAMGAALAMGLQPHGVGVAVIAALVMGIGVGALNGWLVTRIKLPPFIATLGTMTGVYGVMLMYTQEQSIVGQVEWFTLLGTGRIGTVPVPTIIMLVLLVVFQVMLTRTRFGHNMYAVGSSEQAAYQAGIPVDRQRVLAFVISGCCASLSGVLLAARLNSSSMQIGLQTNLLVITGCVMGGASLAGGRGTALAAAVGTLALTVLNNGMDLLSVFTYKQIGVRAVIFLVVVAVDALYVSTVSKRLGNLG